MILEDIYVLIESANRKEIVDYFLEKYLTGFKETSCCYEYPNYYLEKNGLQVSS